MNSLALVVLVPLALAGDPAAPAPAPTAAPAATPAAAPTAAPAATPAPGLELSADLRDEYLTGQGIVVNLTLSNPGATPLAAPDLTARPWLVRFALVKPNGTKQTRYTSPPAQDPGGTVTIPARGQRSTLLEIPSGGLLAPGAYTLAVEANLGDRTISLPARPVRIAAPKPVAADLAPLGLPSARETTMAVWVHQGATGADLYLLSARGGEPTKGHVHRFLARLPAAVEPRISATRAPDGTRHVLWLEGGKTIAIARLEAGLTEQVSLDRVEAAWPRVDLLGRPATDEKGNVHALLWVPAPKGPSGELRLLTVDERGQPSFRRVARLDVRPSSPDTYVDTVGQAHFLVQRPAALDLYSVRSTDSAELPVRGERLWGAEPGQVPLDARFGALPATGPHPGGTALFHSWSSGGAIHARWSTVGGAEISRLDPVVLPEGTFPVATLPRGLEPFGALYREPGGATRLRDGAQDGTLVLPARAWTLARDSAGAPMLLTTDAGGPLAAVLPQLAPIAP